jgi:hypothetical protein
MAIVVILSIMLNVIMLNVIMLSVVAPLIICQTVTYYENQECFKFIS